MNAVPTREIESAELTEPASSPHPVRDRRVDHYLPEGDEGDVWAETHALDDRARDERGSNHAEGGLIAGEQNVRNRPFRIESHASEESVIQSAKPIRARRKRERVANEGPRDPDEAERDVTHHHGIEGVLRSDQSAV